MSCQGSPTLTQYGTTYSTSYPERVIVTTEYVTVTIPARLRARQDPASSTPTTSGEQTFSVNDVTPVARTITITETVVATNTVPTLTLFAPCTTTTVDDSGTNSTTTTTRANPGGNGGSSTAWRPAQVDNANDGKSTTTSDGATIILTELVTTVNGVETIFATPIQTLLNTSDNVLSDSQRTGVIAGAAVGGVCVLVALLGVIFYFRRARKARKRMLAEKNKRPTRHPLEDEADYFPHPAMAQWDAYSTTGSTVSAPRLLRARGSQTGSLFHEDVWPPPTEVMQDPLLTSQDLGSSISLAMGFPHEASSDLQASPETLSPSETAGSLGRRHRSSAYDSIRSTDSADYNRSHSRADSSAPLLDSAGRTISPPPPSMHPSAMASPSSTRGRDPRRSNLRVSYTADEMGGFVNRSSHYRSGTSNSVYSTSSASPQNDQASPLSALNIGSSRQSELGASPSSNDSSLLQDVLRAGSQTQTIASNPPRSDELPPQYHTIPRNT